MFILETLYTNPRAMKALFGFEAAKFEKLAKGMEAEWFNVLARRKGRQRKPGAGQPAKSPAENKNSPSSSSI